MPTYIKELPSKEWFHEHYCIIDNFVCWKEVAMSRGRKSVRAGKKVNTYIDDCGYYRIVVKRQNFALARVIYQMTYGDLTPEFEVDHKDTDKLNNAIENLRKVSQGINKRNKGKHHNRQEDTTGVCLNRKYHPFPNNHKVTEYYVARWYDLAGVLKVKHFNIPKLGVEEAYRLACEYRAKMLVDLNLCGAGYSEQHGLHTTSTPKENYESSI